MTSIYLSLRNLSESTVDPPLWLSRKATQSENKWRTSIERRQAIIHVHCARQWTTIIDTLLFISLLLTTKRWTSLTARCESFLVTAAHLFGKQSTFCFLPSGIWYCLNSEKKKTIYNVGQFTRYSFKKMNSNDSIDDFPSENKRKNSSIISSCSLL